jgi:amino acid adenylation domain-containing protein
MSVVEFIADLQKYNILLWLEEDQLRYRAPKGALTPELRATLTARKAEIIAFLQEAHSALAPALPPIVPLDRSQPIPLSFSQERLWLLDQLEPGSSAYAIHATVGLQGQLDRNALEQAFMEVIRRHEILRTLFPLHKGQPMQVITALEASPLRYHDLEYRDVSEQENVIREQIAAHLLPFDLANGPLLRVTLLRRSESEHILLLTMHHIIADGWSVDLLLHELISIYIATHRGTAALLPSLAVQYADVAHWQRACIKEPALERQRSYWKAKLQGLDTISEIKPDYPRPGVRTFRGQRVVRRLSLEFSRTLKKFSQQEGVTLFITLLTALNILLMRQTGQRDISVGSPVAGRTRAELEPLIGCLVNILVFRTEVSGDLTLRQILQRTRQTAVDAYAHQEIPFEQLLADLRLEHDLSRRPLFQVLLNLLPFTMKPLQVADLTITFLEPPLDEAKFDLTLYVVEDNEIQLMLIYNADLFQHEHMQNFLDQYEYLLHQIVAAPEAVISSFSLIPEGVRALLPDPCRSLPIEWYGPVHVLFARQAARTPTRVAVCGSRGNWTYQELDMRANQLAHALRAHGVQPHDIVAIYGYRCISLIWAVLGVLKAGAAFCLLDAAEPGSRLVSCLQQAQPRAWLAMEAAGQPQPEVAAWIESAQLAYQALLPDGAAEADLLYAVYPRDDPDVAIGPDDIAYVAFTSGSTGRPKGIVGSHRPVSHFVRWQQQTFDLNEEDRFSLLSGIGHDPLLRDIFTPLTIGATVCIPNTRQFDQDEILSWLATERITVVHLTPSLLQFLLPKRSGPGVILPMLRYLFFGGEQLTRYAVVQARQYAPSVVCVNFYGLTETPQAVAYYVVPEEMDGPAAIPIGRGIHGVQVLILHAAQQLAGPGEIGEICIRTPYLASGYLGDEELTHARFIPNPYSKDPADCLHRTGDLGFYLPDGSVQYVGRKDHQVNIRGFRVEPGEIEYHLQGHPFVRNVYVTGSGASTGQDSLIAYLVLESADVADSELRQYLSRRLPNHMIPTAFVRLATLPLTANGKVDERRLPAYGGERPSISSTYEPPSTPLENQVAGIWAEVLGVGQVGRNDNFFELGGHSLSAVLVFHRLQEEFHVSLPLRTLFENPTVASVAQALEAQSATLQDDVSPSIHPLSRGSGQMEDLLEILQSIADVQTDSPS